MTKCKVLIANDTVVPVAEAQLKTMCDVRICRAERDAILQSIPGVNGLFWSSHLKLDKEILDAAGDQLTVVATMSAGYDNIDVEELKNRGIKFSNTPGVLSDAVADIAIFLILGASRRYIEGRKAIEDGTWAKTNGTQWLLGYDLSGSTVGIVGLGNIGQEIARRLRAFKIDKLLYYGRHERPEARVLKAQYVTFDKLLKDSDYVIASLPLTENTKGMFNADAFKKMKKTAIFINISRGEIVNQADLVTALKTELIFAAGLDVTTPEPLPMNDELLALSNCFVTPHLGSATWKTRSSMAELTAKNILNALKGEPLITPVF